MAFVQRKLVRVNPGNGKKPVIYVSIPARLREVFDSDDYVVMFIADEKNGVVFISPESKEEALRRFVSQLVR